MPTDNGSRSNNPSASLKESQTSQDLIEHQKNILKSILEQSRQPSLGAGLPAIKPTSLEASKERHHHEPPPHSAQPLFSNAAQQPPAVGVKKPNTSGSIVGAGAATAGNSSISNKAPQSPSSSIVNDEYMESMHEAKDRRQSWQQIHTQKSVRSYLPSLSVICMIFGQ